MTDQRWWHGVDELVLARVPSGSRVLDVGCGDGGLVHRLAAQGLDAHGVDPEAPLGDSRLLRERVERLPPTNGFDAISAVMSLHHADLDAALEAIGRLLRPRGLLFVYEFAWEAYDSRAAAWSSAHDASPADSSVSAWRREHGDLHTGETIHAALSRAFTIRAHSESPYLARMIGSLGVERDEEEGIASATLPAIGRRYVAERPATT